jgi:hypothetical protein
VKKFIAAFIVIVGFSQALTGICLAQDTAKAEPRKIFAHYMGCFPGGYGPIYWEQYMTDNERAGFRHDSKTNREALAGGRFKAWPLFPEGKQMDPVASSDLEIRRAIREGIDGFDIDTWAGGDGAKQTLDTLFQAAEAGKYPFEITICIDPWSTGAKTQMEGYVSAIKYLLDKHGTSPNLARRGGKPLIFTYQGQGLGAGNPEVKPLSDEAGWASLIEAYKKVETEVGQPLYFYFDISALGLGLPESNAVILPASKYLNKYFGAIGGFVDIDAPMNDAKFVAQLADAVHSGPAEWAPPIWYQYNNWAGHQSVEILGTDKLRSTWQRAREQNATLVQFATWNDYGEHTTLAPTTASYYGIGDLNRYFADWWKTGREPQLPDDRMYVSYKCAVAGCNIFPFTHSGYCAPGNIEVISVLKEPGKIELPGREVDGKPIEYDAPSGFFLKTFPLTKGAVVVELSRNGKVEKRLEGHETVTDRPFRAENILQCASTVDEKYWNEDFPGQPFPKQSYYGDDDSDGLPNWFEMYWFGKWMDFTTDTVADPKADPNKAGKMNLQSYLDQTDPSKAPASYPVGYAWDLADALKVGRLDQDTLDSQGTPVWSYLFKRGKIMQQIDPADKTNNFVYMTYFDGPVRAFSEGQWGGGGMVLLYVADDPKKPNTLNLVPFPWVHPANREAAIGWHSPITGTVDATFDPKWSPNPNPGIKCTASLENSNHETLWSKDYPSSDAPPADAAAPNITVPNIKVSKGDSLYLVVQGSQGILLTDFKLTVTSPASATPPATAVIPQK